MLQMRISFPHFCRISRVARIKSVDKLRNIFFEDAI